MPGVGRSARSERSVTSARSVWSERSVRRWHECEDCKECEDWPTWLQSSPPPEATKPGAISITWRGGVSLLQSLLNLSPILDSEMLPLI